MNKSKKYTSNTVFNRRGCYKPSNVSTSNLTESELGYIAGLLDGEGSITTKVLGKYKRFGIDVSIGNTYKPVIDWIYKSIGGEVYCCGIDNPLAKKISYEWKTQRILSARQFLMNITPYLKIKKIKAEKALRQIAEVLK